jgi:hypothetical protein
MRLPGSLSGSSVAMVSAFVDWIVQGWENYVLGEKGKQIVHDTFSLDTVPSAAGIRRPLRFRHSFAQKTTSPGRIA